MNFGPRSGLLNLAGPFGARVGAKMKPKTLLSIFLLAATILILTGIAVIQSERSASAADDKFDIPALVYNITALEKLRWTIKNSDNPRAILEACMLRMTLSEHFMSAQQLLNNLDNMNSAQPQSIKKKSVNNADTDPKSTKNITPAPRSTGTGLFNSQQNTQAPAADVEPESAKIMEAQKVPVYTTPERAADVMGVLYKRRLFLDKI